jgi:hypothetical protein
MLRCEECISLAICISEIKFYPDNDYSFSYAMSFTGVMERCSYFASLEWGSKDFLNTKRFFLQKKKGLIKSL